jgi:hypothetical protein
MDSDTPRPAFDDAALDRVRNVLATGNALQAADRLCEELRAAEDFQALFYARLLKKRVELGVSPFPTGPSNELPPETHDAYEQAIRDAGREVGGIYLERRQFARAWGFFRMLGEPERMRAALESYQPAEDDDTYAVVELAWQQGLLPEKGFDIILDRHGICSAITMVSGADLGQNPDLRAYCTKRLVRSLHEQLTERLRSDLEGRGVTVSAGNGIRPWIQAHPELFADDLYHIDTSHLHSVVQMSSNLPACPELELAAELCAYGAKLAPHLRGEFPAPFENGYSDYEIYLNILAGKNVEAGLAHFRSKLAEAQREQDTYPAEVLVNLLLKLDRLPEALAVAREFLNEPGRELSCPTPTELARRAKDFTALAEAARAAGDPVNYLAGLIAARG